MGIKSNPFPQKFEPSRVECWSRLKCPLNPGVSAQNVCPQIHCGQAATFSCSLFCLSQLRVAARENALCALQLLSWTRHWSQKACMACSSETGTLWRRNTFSFLKNCGNKNLFVPADCKKVPSEQCSYFCTNKSYFPKPSADVRAN